MLIDAFVYTKIDERLKDFISKDDIEIVIENNRIIFSFHDYKKKEEFYKLLLNNKIKQAYDNELISTIIGKPICSTELLKIQIVGIINKIYNKYKYLSSYVLENE